MKGTSQVLFVLVWMVGVVLAKGFWSTFLAFVLPLWAYYLVAVELVSRFL